MHYHDTCCACIYHKCRHDCMRHWSHVLWILPLSRCLRKSRLDCSEPSLRGSLRLPRPRMTRCLLAEAVQGLVGAGLVVEEEDRGKEKAGAGEGRWQEDARRIPPSLSAASLRMMIRRTVQGVVDGGEKLGERAGKGRHQNRATTMVPRMRRASRKKRRMRKNHGLRRIRPTASQRQSPSRKQPLQPSRTPKPKSTQPLRKQQRPRPSPPQRPARQPTKEARLLMRRPRKPKAGNPLLTTKLSSWHKQVACPSMSARRRLRRCLTYMYTHAWWMPLHVHTA